jgi:hypothetical protein
LILSELPFSLARHEPLRERAGHHAIAFYTTPMCSLLVMLRRSLIPSLGRSVHLTLRVAR